MQMTTFLKKVYYHHKRTTEKAFNITDTSVIFCRSTPELEERILDAGGRIERLDDQTIKVTIVPSSATAERKRINFPRHVSSLVTRRARWPELQNYLQVYILTHIRPSLVPNMVNADPNDDFAPYRIYVLPPAAIQYCRGVPYVMHPSRHISIYVKGQAPTRAALDLFLEDLMRISETTQLSAEEIEALTHHHHLSYTHVAPYLRHLGYQVALRPTHSDHRRTKMLAALNGHEDLMAAAMGDDFLMHAAYNFAEDPTTWTLFIKEYCTLPGAVSN